MERAKRKLRHPLRLNLLLGAPRARELELEAEIKRQRIELEEKILRLHNKLAALRKEHSLPAEEPENDENPILGQAIDVLDLSLRSWPCLTRAGIGTIGQLVSKTAEDLAKLRNMGRKSVEEVESKLAENGLTLAEPEE